MVGLGAVRLGVRRWVGHVRCPSLTSSPHPGIRHTRMAYLRVRFGLLGMPRREDFRPPAAARLRLGTGRGLLLRFIRRRMAYFPSPLPYDLHPVRGRPIFPPCFFPLPLAAFFFRARMAALFAR
jgi:hypothetical protein